ncbi:hypothetical protein Tco_0623069 [Tanacetum coccineum]
MLSKWDVKFVEAPISTRSVLRTKKLRALKRLNIFSNGEKYHVGPPGYYTRIDKHQSFGEKKPSLEDLMNKHLEESIRRRAKLQETAEINTQNQSNSLKNLETQIELLIKEFHVKNISEMNNSSFDLCKAVYDDKEAPLNNEINEPHEVSFVSDGRTHVVQEQDVSSKIFPCQLPLKELNPRNFTPPCTIGS